MTRKPKQAKPKPDRLIVRDGALWQKCWHKCRRTRPVEEFAPRKSEANLAVFLQAAALYQSTQGEAARATVVQHATGMCDHCRDSKERSRVNPTTKPGQCRAYLHHLRATSFRVCVHCKTTRCIELDNVVSDADRAVLFREGKVYVAKHHALGDYPWWSIPAHGGVEGMKLETCVVEPCCRMCHTLQPTGKQGNRVDPDTLPPTYPGEKRDGDAGQKMYDKRRHATRSWPRYCYNDGLKRGVGQCENLDCPRDGPGGGYCVAGVEQAFDWEHVNAVDKKKNISELCSSLPAGMPEAEWKAEIQAELKRGDCRLLCRNCHHLKTHYGMVPTYAPRRDEVEVVMYDGLSDEQMLRLLGV